MEKTKLASNFSVQDYLKFKEENNREKISDLIFERFFERYIEPFKDNPAKHGFSMMASGCLMVESLYCFQKGRKKTGESGKSVFENFFKDSSSLTDFTDYGEEFYKNVRCGILHQGETYAGWKIQRKGKLFEKSTKTINATRFIDSMEKELKCFADLLKTRHFHRQPWRGVIRKLDHICSNCKVTD